MAGFDHVFLDIGSKPMLRAEDRRQSGARMRGQVVDDVDEMVIHRGRVADDANALTVETCRSEQPFGSQRDSHKRIIAYEMRQHGDHDSCCFGRERPSTIARRSIWALQWTAVALAGWSGRSGGMDR